MTRLYFSLFILVVMLSCNSPQPKVYADYTQVSGYYSTTTDSTTIANLEVLARVWGYAKYHHPVFADSTLNIDYELFELLPKVAHVDKATRNKVLYEWVDGLGEFESDKSYYQKYLDSSHVFVNNYEWAFDAALLGGKLSGLLTELRYAQREENAYIEEPEDRSILPDGIKEASYPYNSNLDVGFRLLQLFRYWNIIDSYAANRNITDKPWDKVLTEYIPKMIKNERYAVYQLISELNDTHAFVRENLFGRNRIPITAKFLQGKLTVTEHRHHHSLEIGDEIISVDGQTTSEIIAKVKKYTSHSNNATLLRDAALTAFYTDKDSIQIEYIRDGKNENINVRRMTYNERYAYLYDTTNGHNEAFRMINDSVGYIHIGVLSIKDSERIMEALKKTKAVIVDIRCYPSGSVHFSFFGRHFFKTPIHHVTFKFPLVILPGYIYYESIKVGYDDNKPYNVRNNPDAYSGKVILLVNEETQSSAEYLAMVLQARPNTITIGSQTAGADGNVVNIPLPGDINSYFSGIGVLYPDGTDTQRTGVRIDVEVHPTIQGIKTGRDELLEKALELID